MLPEHRVLLEDESRPVPDEILGEMYRASANGLNELLRRSRRQPELCSPCIATVAPTLRRSD